MVTQKDIAEKLGLSLSSVSRALSSEPEKNSAISKVTRDTVLRTARELGFRPNRSASLLRKGKTAAIGIFLPAYDQSIMMRLVHGISTAAIEGGYPLYTYFAETGNASSIKEQEKSFLGFMENMTDLSCSGVLAYSSFGTNPRAMELLSKYHEGGGHAVMLNGHLQERECRWFESWPEVNIDDFKGGQIAADRLIERRVRKFIALKQANSSYSNIRMEGFRSTIKEFGLECVIEDIPNWNTLLLSDLRRVVLKYLQDEDNLPLGVFAGSDQVAMIFLRILDEFNLKAGKDVFLVGYNNNHTSSFTNPPLTTIHQPFFELGKLAMQKLTAMIGGEKGKSEKIEPWLLVRDTA